MLGWGRETYLCVHVAEDTAAAAATATCDCMLRLLATSEKSAAFITGRGDTVSSPLSGAGLSLFFHACRDNLQTLWLTQMVLSEDLCLALATMSRPDVELNLVFCSLSNDAAGAFKAVEVQLSFTYAKLTVRLSPTLWRATVV
jgi:hypothetical protein